MAELELPRHCAQRVLVGLAINLGLGVLVLIVTLMRWTKIQSTSLGAVCA